MKNTANMIRLLLGVAAFAALSACAVDLELEGDNGYACTSDDDCVSGFLCSNIGRDGATGRCVREGADPGNLDCRDLDQDGAFVGGGCSANRPRDCDDTNNAIGPQAAEVCDGVDNNCDCDRTTGDSNGDGVICGPGDDNVDEGLPTRPCPLQSGLCRGAQTSCVDGAYEDCGSDAIYGEDYEVNEISCDGIDNDCDNAIDETCDCIPGTDEAFECGFDIGACDRGIQLCSPDGSLSACVLADDDRRCANGSACRADAECTDGSECLAVECETSDDCDEGGVCVDELMDHRENLYDDCISGSTIGCERSVCRYPNPSTACEDDTTCDGGACIDGFCHARVQPSTEEVCNGIDDSCNGSIDDDFQREAVCGACPFNAEFLNIATLQGASVQVCVDRYEASRIDATDVDPGTSNLYATAVPNAIPWTNLEPEDAAEACSGSVLRELSGGTRQPVATRALCRNFEWAQACGGKFGTAEDVDFPYATRGDGNVFVAGACNDGTLGLTGPQPTGTASNCCSPHNICDASGNVAEYIEGAGQLPLVAGGSYLTTDEAILACGAGRTEYEAVPADPTARDDIGFRCCSQPR